MTIYNVNVFDKLKHESNHMRILNIHLFQKQDSIQQLHLIKRSPFKFVVKRYPVAVISVRKVWLAFLLLLMLLTQKVVFSFKPNEYWTNIWLILYIYL